MKIIQFNSPLQSSQLHLVLRATLGYRLITIVVAILTLPIRSELPTSMAQSYALIPIPLAFLNFLAIIYAKPLVAFLRRHPTWLAIDLVFSIGIILAGGGWRSSYFVYTLTTIIIFTIFANKKGTCISAFVLALVSTCKNPLPNGDPLQIFDVTNWDLRLGASLFYITACLILSYFTTIIERLNSLTEERIVWEREHSAMKQKINLAFDLHDRLKSKLSAILLIAGMLAKKTAALDDQTAKDTKRLWQWLNYCQSELDQLVLSLKTNKESHPLENRMIDLCRLAKEEIRIFSAMTGFYCSVETDESDIMVPEPMKPVLGAFISEALTNSWKHSGTTNGVIRLERNRDQVKIEIIDHGEGFELLQVDRSKASGLTSLTHRAEELHGQLAIKTSPDRGCSCILTFSITELN
jgi:signal transduction histidine kinase